MFKPFPLFIGLRYTRAKQKNHFISVISLISMIGMILGVAVMITVLSIMNGFESELKARVLGMIPHAVISSDQWFDEPDKVINLAKKEPHVMAAAPLTQMQAMVSVNGDVAGVLLNGIDPLKEGEVSILPQHMVLGQLKALQPGEFGVVVGKSLADRLGITLNQKITIVLPDTAPTPAGVIPRFKRFTVVGIYEISQEVDSLLAYINLEDAAKLVRMPPGAQSIRLKTDDLFDAPHIAQKLATRIGTTGWTTDWTQTHGNLFAAIKMEKAMVGLLLFLIIVVAAFNIISSLVMLVTDKTSDIAILRTMGATKKEIMQIFVIQGMFIGVVGAVIGTVLGILSALFISDILNALNNFFGLHLFDAYFIQYLPSKLDWENVAIIVAAAILLSFLATLYPAYKATKISPAEALRYE